MIYDTLNKPNVKTSVSQTIPTDPTKFLRHVPKKIEEFQFGRRQENSIRERTIKDHLRGRGQTKMTRTQPDQDQDRHQEVHFLRTAT